MKKLLLIAAAASTLALAPAVHANATISVGATITNSEIKAGGYTEDDTGYKLHIASEFDVASKGYAGVRLGLADYGSYAGSKAKSLYGDVYYGHEVIRNGSILGFAGIGTFKVGSATGSAAQFGVGYRHTFGNWAVQAEMPFYELMGDVDGFDFKAKLPSVGVSYSF